MLCLGEVRDKLDGNNANASEFISVPADKLAYHFLEIIGETVYNASPEDVCIFANKLFNAMAEESSGEQLATFL